MYYFFPYKFIGEIISYSKKIIARFYKIVVEIETGHKEEDSMFSLIKESFYFKVKSSKMILKKD